MPPTLDRTRKHRLTLDGLRVESFTPQPDAAPLAMQPPTRPDTWPPCCSEQYVCA
jgi:hypothetical protein